MVTTARPAHYAALQPVVPALTVRNLLTDAAVVSYIANGVVAFIVARHVALRLAGYLLQF